MTNPTVTLPTDIADSAQVPASAFVPVNQRATSGSMPLSVQADIPTFPGPATVSGAWTVAGTRVTATGLALVNAQSVGAGVSPVGAPSGPLKVLTGNQRVLIAF